MKTGDIIRELQSGPGPGPGAGTKILFFTGIGTGLEFPAGPGHIFLSKIRLSFITFFILSGLKISKINRFYQQFRKNSVLNPNTVSNNLNLSIFCMSFSVSEIKHT